MEKRLKSSDSHKVRTVSYWTHRRKIRAAFDEFFSSVENNNDADVSAAHETEQINDCMLPVHVDEVTCENDNGAPIPSPTFVSSDYDSECEMNEFVSHGTHIDEEEPIANILVDWVSNCCCYEGRDDYRSGMCLQLLRSSWQTQLCSAATQGSCLWLFSCPFTSFLESGLCDQQFM